MTRAFVITLSENESSFKQADVLIDSSSHFRNVFVIEKYKATTPDEVVEAFLKENIKWNYPWTQSVLDLQTGLRKSAYETADPKKRMACFMSHYLLWKRCAEEDEDMLIFEHDAVFIRTFSLDEVRYGAYDVVSLNDPRGATRKSQVYNELIEGKKLTEVPWLDDRQIPQGLPGNSAYYIRKAGAKKLLSLVKEYGAWPNDAIMCKQLMPKKLGCVGQYVTRVQKTHQSSTTK